MVKIMVPSISDRAYHVVISSIEFELVILHLMGNVLNLEKCRLNLTGSKMVKIYVTFA
jgi:hypothetical protein